MADIDFNDLDKKATTNIKIKKEEVQPKKEGLFEGWTKGPLLIGGAIALFLIALTVILKIFVL